MARPAGSGAIPPAWGEREGSAIRILDFEAVVEPLGLTALAIQVITGLAIAFVVVGEPIWLGGLR